MKEWASRINPCDLIETEKSFFEAIENKSNLAWQAEYQFRKTDNTYAYVEENGYIIRDDTGRAVRMIGVVRDITRQKEEEHHLKLLESVVTNSNEAVMIATTDPNDITGLRILYANEAFTKISGYELKDVIGKSTSLFAGPAGDNYDGEIQSAIKNGRFIQTEIPQLRKNGEQFWLNLSIFPVEDHKGNITHWVNIGHDVTDRKKYVQAIEDQNNKLKSIAWMQSHMVRAPLSRIMGLIDLINNYPNSDAERKELLSHILKSAHELDGIIREISGKTELSSVI